MIGRVGDDLFGERLKSSLNSVGVSVESVLSTVGESTGIALILVETGGENQIAVAAGANGRLSPDDVRAKLEHTSAQYLLLQLETPLPTVEAAAIEGRRRGMSVILDPAPAVPLSSSLLSSIDVLTPNESEALVLLGARGGSISLDQAEKVCSKLLDSRSVMCHFENGTIWRLVCGPKPKHTFPGAEGSCCGYDSGWRHV